MDEIVGCVASFPSGRLRRPYRVPGLGEGRRLGGENTTTLLSGNPLSKLSSGRGCQDAKAAGPVWRMGLVGQLAAAGHILRPSATRLIMNWQLGQNVYSHEYRSIFSPDR